jgi:hypothetical protein
MTHYQHQLFLFYQKAITDERLLPTHMALYFALFWSWQLSGYQNIITIYRKELMPIARINSIATYHKCIKDLTQFGYIDYKPSYNYYKGSQVFLL